MLGSRWLRFALCVFFLPLVMVFANPTTATAATSETLNIEMGQGECHIGVAISGTSITVGNGGWCKGGPDGSPGFCSLYEACTVATIRVNQSSGQCGSGGIEVISSTGTIARTMFLGAASIPIGSCDPTEICIDLEFNDFGFDDEDTGCVTTSLDPPAPESVDGCSATQGDPILSPILGASVIQDEVNTNFWRVRVRVLGGIPDPPGPSNQNWRVYIVGTGIPFAQSGFTTYGGQSVNVNTHDQTAVVGTNMDLAWEIRSGLISEEEEANRQLAEVMVEGIGFIAYDNGFKASWQVTNIPNHVDNDGLLGITDPQRCAYYWGNKIANVTGTSTDEPVGPVNDEDPGGEDTEPPPVDQPDPEEDDGFGWLAALLGKLLSAIKGLASAIGNMVQAILDGLLGLFVPDGDVLEGEFDKLDDVWEDTAPSKYLETATDFEPGSMSGCGGIPLDAQLGAGVEVHEHLGAACSGSMANAAAVVRFTLSAVFVIGGIFACLRVLGSGLGWNPGIGRVEA